MMYENCESCDKPLNEDNTVPLADVDICKECAEGLKEGTQVLAPCPFCGKDLTYIRDESFLSVPSFIPVCDRIQDGCGAKGPLATTPEEAIERWNRRKS